MFSGEFGVDRLMCSVLCTSYNFHELTGRYIGCRDEKEDLYNRGHNIYSTEEQIRSRSYVQIRSEKDEDGFLFSRKSY